VVLRLPLTTCNPIIQTIRTLPSLCLYHAYCELSYLSCQFLNIFANLPSPCAELGVRSACWLNDIHPTNCIDLY
jgi:hypothetical protein